MNRTQRHAASGRRYAGQDRISRQLEETIRQAAIPEKERSEFLSWMVADSWKRFKEERMNQRLIIENQIRDQKLQFPNGTVKKEYAIDFTLPTDQISDIRLEGAEELGLTLTVGENGKCSLAGNPQIPGDFMLRLRFSTVKGEPDSEIQIPIAFNPSPRDLWKNIPTDPNIPYYKADSQTESIEVEGTPDSYPRKRMVAASQRGRSHAQEGRPRDDDFGLYHCEKSDWYILAVADGAGSARYSRKGSEVACRTVVDYCREKLYDNPELEHQIKRFAEDRKDEERRNKMTGSIIDIIYHAARRAHEAVKILSVINEDTNSKDFATTLMFAICRKFDFGWFVASFWVGDGAIALYDEKEGSVKLLGTPDEGEFSGQTRFLTMPEIFKDPEFVSKRMRISLVDDFTALFLMTDGISDPMFETERNLSDYSCWKAFYNKLTAGFPADGIGGVDFNLKPSETEGQLLSWLDFWSPGNHDDRTIAVLY